MLSNGIYKKYYWNNYKKYCNIVILQIGRNNCFNMLKKNNLPIIVQFVFEIHKTLSNLEFKHQALNEAVNHNPSINFKFYDIEGKKDNLDFSIIKFTQFALQKKLFVCLSHNLGSQIFKIRKRKGSFYKEMALVPLHKENILNLNDQKNKIILIPLSSFSYNGPNYYDPYNGLKINSQRKFINILTGIVNFGSKDRKRSSRWCLQSYCKNFMMVIQSADRP
ncbi:hypothetical protein BpHYR1_046179 [Brachionus plicatilis]|uniref:Uncharacterized protein n=1 Tax=Brachionus plicatilis TaxID=10195 RepID=A0A3M7S3U7_BRAPC|nr:hypothetical protein BpHYR1_046179 [Brachionus plicatilis]